MLPQFWDKVKAPFIAVGAIVVTLTALFGLFKNINKWNEASALIMQVKTKVDSMAVRQSDPRIGLIIINLTDLKTTTTETRQEVSIVKDILTKHFAHDKSITTDSLRAIMKEFYEKKN